MYAVSKVADTHARVQSAPHNGPTRDLFLSMLQAAAADTELYENLAIITQLCSAQYSLGMYCSLLPSQFNAPSVANVTWSLASQGWGFGNVRVNLDRQVFDTAADTDGQDVSKTIPHTTK